MMLFLKGDLKGGPDNILGFKEGKMLIMNEMLFFQPYLKK
jgi:hypothetical protein